MWEIAEVFHLGFNEVPENSSLKIKIRSHIAIIQPGKQLNIFDKRKIHQHFTRERRIQSFRPGRQNPRRPALQNLPDPGHRTRLNLHLRFL